MPVSNRESANDQAHEFAFINFIAINRHLLTWLSNDEMRIIFNDLTAILFASFFLSSSSSSPLPSGRYEFNCV